MIQLHIEHAVMNFDAWKAAFDNDPVGRRQSGVRCYRILRPVESPEVVMIDLELDTLDQAKALLAAMQEVWKRVGGSLIQSPQWRISELAEAKAY